MTSHAHDVRKKLRKIAGHEKFPPVSPGYTPPTHSSLPYHLLLGWNSQVLVENWFTKAVRPNQSPVVTWPLVLDEPFFRDTANRDPASTNRRVDMSPTEQPLGSHLNYIRY